LDLIGLDSAAAIRLRHVDGLDTDSESFKREDKFLGIKGTTLDRTQIGSVSVEETVDSRTLAKVRKRIPKGQEIFEKRTYRIRPPGSRERYSLVVVNHVNRQDYAMAGDKAVDYHGSLWKETGRSEALLSTLDHITAVFAVLDPERNGHYVFFVHRGDLYSGEYELAGFDGTNLTPVLKVLHVWSD
jgi:hypothetical protein